MDPRAEILIVDDEVEIGQLVGRYLGLEGFRAEIRTRGRDALEAFAGRPYSLVILDLMLPDIDGFEVCRQLRRQSDVPILMLTAKDGTPEKVRGLGLGADDYVAKPFDIDELVARVKALLRRSQNRGGETLRFPGLTLDRDSRTLAGDREFPELTVLEFNLLWLLAESPHRVFTRDLIRQGVWGSDVHLDENTLSVHIRRLRKKIEVDPDEPRIVLTVRNLGYRFGLRPLP